MTPDQFISLFLPIVIICLSILMRSAQHAYRVNQIKESRRKMELEFEYFKRTEGIDMDIVEWCEYQNQEIRDLQQILSKLSNKTHIDQDTVEITLPDGTTYHVRRESDEI